MKPLKKVYRGLPARRSLVAMLTLIVACSLSNARAQNTATGVTALTNVTPAGTSGTNNTADGAYALKDDTTGSYNLDIDDFGADTSSDTNTIRIGNASYENAAFIAGIRGITTGASDAVEVLIDSNGQLGTISSSRRYKQDITDMGMPAHGSCACVRSPSAIRSRSRTAVNRSNTASWPRRSPKSSRSSPCSTPRASRKR